MLNKKLNRAVRAFASLAFLIGAAFLNQTFAQTTEAQAAKIRSLYAETNRRIEAGLKDKTSGLHYAAWTLGGTSDGQQWRAVGAMKTTDEFWFDGEPGFDEGQIADARKTIRRIVSSYANAGGVPRSRGEYLFNEAGELVFVFSIEYEAGEENSSVERRFYFAKNKLIRVAAKGANKDGKFTAEELEAAKSEQAAAKRLQNIFALAFSE